MIIKVLEKMSEELKGEKHPYLDHYHNYLTDSLTEELAVSYLEKNKTLTGIHAYVSTKARNEAQDGVAMIKRETVYSWIIDYILNNEKEAEIKKTKTTNEKSKKQAKTDLENKTVQPSLF